MAQPDLLARTLRYAIDIIKFSDLLPNRQAGWAMSKQIVRSGPSVGSNYREAQRARSRAEFHSKIQICRQELEETHYWLELIAGSELVPSAVCEPYLAETKELIAIFTAIAKKLETGD